jgi:hypothetical protein
MMAGRYAHAKQFKRHHRQLRLLRSRLGRIIRDVRRKIAAQPALQQAFEPALSRASQIRSASVHADLHHRPNNRSGNNRSSGKHKPAPDGEPVENPSHRAAEHGSESGGAWPCRATL